MASFSMYHPETIRQFQGNPFIEALPPRASDAEIILQLQHRPEYDPADRLKPAEDRTMLVQILSRIFQPCEKDFDIYRKIERCIRFPENAANPGNA